MSKMRLGGVKALDKHAYLTSLCHSGKDTLGDICSRLATDRINLNFLIHIADTGLGESITSACTEGTDGSPSYIHWKASHGRCNIGELLTDVNIISIFPHDQNLNVSGSLIGVLARRGIVPYGFASSPSAMTALISSTDFDGIIDGLFDTFEFPACSSAADWQAAYRIQERPLREVACSYQEDIIKIYNISHYVDLDLWNVGLPLKCLSDFGGTLLDLHELQLRIPFLVSKFSQDLETIFFSFCLAAASRDEVKHALHQHLPSLDPSCFGPVSLFFILGPHFGDRYGIANTLLRVLKTAGIPLLALSYTVSSFSLVIQGNSPDQTIEALHSNFQIPGRKP